MGTLRNTHQPDFRILDRPELPVASHAAGSTIVAKGEPALVMFLVRKGRVAIRLKDKTVEEVGPGGIFGEMALIDHGPRSASAVALEDTEVVPIDERFSSPWFRRYLFSPSTLCASSLAASSG